MCFSTDTTIRSNIISRKKDKENCLDPGIKNSSLPPVVEYSEDFSIFR